MDNIRNVIGCPVAGLTPHELFDASPVVHEFTAMFMGNKAFTNLPRKFNVAITGCTENCGHTDAQDLSLTPAATTIDGRPVHGFNVAVGGKMGSGGCRLASPLNVFVDPGARGHALQSHRADLSRSRTPCGPDPSPPRVPHRRLGSRALSGRTRTQGALPADESGEGRGPRGTRITSASCRSGNQASIRWGCSCPSAGSRSINCSRWPALLKCMATATCGSRPGKT